MSTETDIEQRKINMEEEIQRFGLISSSNDFGTALYKAMFDERSTENFVLSPLGLQTVIGSIGQGARGETKSEIVRSLKLSDDPGKVGRTYLSVNSRLNAGGGPQTFTLLTANRVYSRTGFGLNQHFLVGMNKYFQTDFEQLDLSTSEKCQDAVKRINKWAEGKTDGKIKDIIRLDSLDSIMTQLVLINGIYLKGYLADFGSFRFFGASINCPLHNPGEFQKKTSI